MNKKLLSIFLAFAMVVTILPTYAFAATSVSGKRYGHSSNGDGTKIIRCYDNIDNKNYCINIVDDKIMAKETTEVGNGEFIVTGNYTTFETILNEEIQPTYGIFIKSTGGKYLSINSSGKLVLTSTQPKTWWVNDTSYADVFYTLIDGDKYYMTTALSSDGLVFSAVKDNNYEYNHAGFSYNCCNHDNMQYINVNRATCYYFGKIDYYYCPNCEGSFMDKIGKNHVINFNESPTGHNDVNGDGACDGCGLNLSNSTFSRVLDESGLAAGSTYIVVDDKQNIMMGLDDFNDNNYSDFLTSFNSKDLSNAYRVKSQGGLFFDIYNKKSNSNTGDYTFYSGANTIFLLSYGGFAFASAVESMEMGVGADIIFNDGFVSFQTSNNYGNGTVQTLHSYTNSQGKTIFTMLSLDDIKAEMEREDNYLSDELKDLTKGATENKLYLYRLDQCVTKSGNKVNVMDANCEYDYTLNGAQTISKDKTVNTTVGAISSAIKIESLEKYAPSFSTDDNVLYAKAKIEVTDYLENPEQADESINPHISFKISPVITDGKTTSDIKNWDYNGNSMTVTVTTGDIYPGQVIVKHANKKQEEILPFYEAVERGARMYYKVEYLYDDNFNQYYNVIVCGLKDLNEISIYQNRIEIVNDEECEHDFAPATCVEPKMCTICGEFEGKALGHSWDSGKVTKKATCIAIGNKTYTCTVCDETRIEEIPKTAHNYKSTTTKATPSKNGSVLTKCSVCGSTKSNITIYYPKTISLSATSYTYDGNVKTPSVTVKDSKGKTLKRNTDYTVSYASGRKYVGKYAVKITFKGNYSGTKTLYFNINPKGTAISKLTPKSKAITVQWKKQSTQTTGYQIQYSTSSKFTNTKTVTVSKNSTTSKTITKLSGKKKYYVRVRTYKKVGSTNYYSSWSSVKSVTTKK